MAEKKLHHHWKLLLSIILVVGIMGLLFYTDTGKETLDFFKIGKFVETTPTNVEYFSIELDATEQTFYAQSYKVSNSTFIASGICQQVIKINDINLNRDGVLCKVTLNSLSGSFYYTEGGSTVTTGKVANMKIDDNLYSAENMEIRVEVIPNSLLLTGASEKTIVLQSATGKISKLRGDGSVATSGFPENDYLEISNFIGYVNLENGRVVLKGVASSVKAQEFEW